MRMIKYLWALPLALALIITGCSDNDDYQVAEPLQAGNQQVHFSRRFPLPSRMLRPVSLLTSR